MNAHLDWLRTGRAPRGTPQRRGAPRRFVALALIAGLALVQAGCQSGPLSGCGSCGSCGFIKRTTDRLLHRPSSCCDSGAVGGTAVEYGAPSAVVAPTLGSSQYSTGTVPSDVTVPPSNLNPIESAPKTRIAPVPGASSSSTGSGANKTGYYARQTSTRTAVRLDSGSSSGRAAAARPADAAPADEATRDDDNPLDHLPPLALPGEVTQSESKTPAPSANRPEGRSGDSAVPETSARSQDAGEEDTIGLALLADAASEAEVDPAAMTGIARFASVDPRLAGGAVPSNAGLTWLVDKGYRTVLDLRESAEVSPSFIAEAANRGLRYVALPVNLKTLDPERLSRFQFELAAPEARPLFFFDADGSRAGALWYIRRVTVDKVDPQLARREAEDIGLKDRATWDLAADYVRRAEAAKAHPAPATAVGASEPFGPATSRSDLPGQTAPAAAGTTEGRSTTAPVAPNAESLSSQAPMYFRPFAAMLLTGLSLPLAYWTRTAIPEAIARVRASLPAPGPRPRSIRDESGA